MESLLEWFECEGLLSSENAERVESALAEKGFPPTVPSLRAMLQRCPRFLQDLNIGSFICTGIIDAITGEEEAEGDEEVAVWTLDRDSTPPPPAQQPPAHVYSKDPDDPRHISEINHDNLAIYVARCDLYNLNPWPNGTWRCFNWNHRNDPMAFPFPEDARTSFSSRSSF
ncbi:hypothetical protein B484DRAFT_473909 [Ochromonadaceae sp. CCMP2298]|jgi:hypothetical protein|nr:hypothetical protein B484DRAFT_473909 [Ochromonadaceae sp. CCMP2298]